MHGIRLLATYAFDEDAYNRFYPLAINVGVQYADFMNQKSKGIRFFSVQIQIQ